MSPLVSILVAAACISSAPEAAMSSSQSSAPRTLDTHHCMTPPATRAEWESRAKRVRTQILVSAGLFPMPAKTPLRPIVTGRVERDDFIAENVAIETLPGFRLCGNLYRPKGKAGPFPAIVNPHGHWANGRLEVQPEVEKAPPPPGKMGEGKANLVAIGVELARRGFVVFAYDMVGYNDTNQATHQFAGSLQPWLDGVSLMGLQLWNSIRAVDFVCALKDVDRRRIGVTGASGGGTQTFLLTAVDDRVRSSVPVNMVSASMQGGCLCENGPGLRVGTDNVEIAALAAPRSLLLIAATGDWTRNVPTEEWPAIRKVYDLYGAADKTACRQFNYGHNYNVESRAAMLAWFERTLKPGAPSETAGERPFQLDTHAMRVWNEAHQRPAGIESEAELAAAMRRRAREALDAVLPRREADVARFRTRMAPALACALGISELPGAGRRSRKQGTPRVLIVTADGASPAEAGDIAEALTRAGRDVTTIHVGSVVDDRKALWNAFYTCYNQTSLGAAAEKVARELLRMRSEGSEPDVLGLKAAGLPTLLGRALAGGAGGLAVDLPAVEVTVSESEPALAYAPCLNGVGGTCTALAMVASAPVVVATTDSAEKISALRARLGPLADRIQWRTGLIDARALPIRPARP